jgi:hypothetical protein
MSSLFTEEECMSSDNQFTALGPAIVGFQTNSSSIDRGAEIAGKEVGVRAQGDRGFGVVATGGGGGVHGKGLSQPQSDPPTFAGPTAVGVLGESVDSNGVVGVSVVNDGVAGFTRSLRKSGVFGYNSLKTDPSRGTPEFPRPTQVGFGVFGRCDLVDGAGVGGRSEGIDPLTGRGGVGVIGTSEGGTGVVGISHVTEDKKYSTDGVFGGNDNGTGVHGESSIGTGVFGHSKRGWGVHGSSDDSYGGNFTSNFAQLRLEPSSYTGIQVGNHTAGEFFVDENGDLYFCKVGGNPGTWVKIA